MGPIEDIKQSVEVVIVLNLRNYFLLKLITFSLIVSKKLVIKPWISSLISLRLGEVRFSYNPSKMKTLSRIFS